ncbi:MAG: TlpA disulfide reductase family protein [Niabella sp.]
MKKTIFLLGILAPALSFAQTLSLSGKISGLSGNAKVSLYNLEKNNELLAEGEAKNGVFQLSTTLPGATIVGLSVADSLNATAFLSNESVSVSGAANQNPDEWVFKGSATQDAFVAFQSIFSPKFQQLNAIAQQAQLSASDSARQQLDAAIDDIQQETDAFINKYPASPVSTMLILTTASLSDNTELLEKRAAVLKPEALNSTMGGHLNTMLEDARFNSVGNIAPDFSQTDKDGKLVSLSQFRGKYVLIDFWASWCKPCRMENPFLVKTFQKFKDKNFTVLGVSLDEDKEKWLAAVKSDGLTWTHVSDLKYWENEVAKQYHIRAIPRNLLIGPDGKILAKDLRGEALEAKLTEILK